MNLMATSANSYTGYGGFIEQLVQFVNFRVSILARAEATTIKIVITEINCFVISIVEFSNTTRKSNNRFSTYARAFYTPLLVIVLLFQLRESSRNTCLNSFLNMLEKTGMNGFGCKNSYK